MLVGYVTRKEIRGWFKCGEKRLRKDLALIGITHRGRLTPIEFALYLQRFGDRINIME